jgi:hypothetical protein
MTYSINKNEARLIARQDLTIFREINFLMEKVIEDSGLGLYQSVVSDGSTMTESTPLITLTGTVSNPTTTVGNTFIINGTTITLGTTGTNLNSIIADINDAAVSGVTATKNSSNRLVINYIAPAATTWSLSIGAGTANTDLGFTNNTTTTATNPSSVNYWGVWQGLENDRARADQMNQVVSYFTNLGYTIERQTNTSTNRTFNWVITY